MANVLKFRTFFFLFSNKMFPTRAGIHKMLVRIGSREDLDQIAFMMVHVKALQLVLVI